MAFAYCRSITIPTIVATETNFPLLFAGTYSYLATVGNGGNVTSQYGYDIAFYSDAGLNTRLSFEIEKYEPTTGEVAFWIKIPTLTSGTNIYIAYGDSGITTFLGNSDDVWDNNYVGIYHLKNGTILSGTDTKNNNHLTNSTANGGLATATTGKIDGGALFNNTGTLSKSANVINLPATNGILTVSLWFTITSLTTSRTAFTLSSGASLFQFVISSAAGNVRFTKAGGSGILGGAFTPLLNTLYYAAFTYDGTTNRPYYNGSPSTTSTVIHDIGATTAIYISTYNGAAEQWSGIIDEVRISNVVRSDTWIATEYANQNNPSGWYSVGNASNALKTIQF